MEKLPDEQRDCLHFVFYEGLSLSEIAELQQCPENTVKTRLFHARQKIKHCLAKVREAPGHDN
jgi:RNA polymerase sigma-70 factor (ECF subfamily)